MSDDDNGDDETTYTADVSVGAVSVSVEGDDPEEVCDLLDEKLDTAVDKAHELGVHEQDETFHVEAGAGWLIAHGDGNTPAEAVEHWEYMWDRMMDDVEELTEKQREQAGLSR